MLTNNETKEEAGGDDMFRDNIQSLIIAFLSMTLGILAGASGFLTQLADLHLLSSDRLSRIAGGGVAVLFLAVIFLYLNKTWEERRKISVLAAKYLILLAAGVLAAALFSAKQVYYGRAFQEWASSYENTAVWSYTFNTQSTLPSVLRGVFFRSLASVFIFAFGANHVIPRLNIKLVRHPAKSEK